MKNLLSGYTVKTSNPWATHESSAHTSTVGDRHSEMSTELSTQTFPNINSRVNDTHTLQITQRKLKETNSLEWSQSNIENWLSNRSNSCFKGRRTRLSELGICEHHADGMAG